MVDFDQFLLDMDGALAAVGYAEDDRRRNRAYMHTHAWRFRRMLASIDGEPAPRRLLDIGATPFTIFLKQRFPDCEVWGLDRTELLAARLAAAGVQMQVCDLNAQPLPFEPEFFDTVFFTETLEHLFVRPSEVLTEVHRVLRPGGRLIFSVPNIAILRNRLKLLFGRSPLEDADAVIHKQGAHGHGHLHEYTRREALAVLRCCGFRIGRVEFLHHRLRDDWHDPSRSPGHRLVRTLYHAAERLWPSFAPTIFIETWR